MDFELKRLLSLIRNRGALTNGVPTSETFDNTTDSLERISDNVGQPQSRTNFQSLETMLGVPDAANSNLDDIVRTGFDSSAITANVDGSVLERLEGLAQTQGLTDALILAEHDEFDVADADANTERWNVAYISGAEGGSADINTTTAGKLMVKVDPDATPTASGYAAYLAQPVTSKYLTAIVDVSATFGTSSGSWATTGIRVSPTTYDTNNVVYLQRQRSTGGVQNRLAAGAIFGGVNQGEVYFTTADLVVAFKVERQDNVWRLYYSLAQYPDYTWVLLTQYEDATEGMDAQQSVYLDAYSPGTLDDETVQGDFDNFKLYLGVRGIDQQVAGDYDSSAVAADEDGSVLERLEQIQEAVNRGAGTSLAANKSLADALGSDGNAVTDSATSVLGAVGANNANNAFDSGNVVGNVDGSTLERVEAIQRALNIVATGAGGGFEEDGTPNLVTALGTNGSTVTDSATSVLGAVGADNANNAFASTNVAANEDGSVLERLEQLQEAVNRGSGTSLAANKSVVDALGTDGTTVTDSAVSVLGAIGANNGDNAFDSSSVAANVDGSVLERLEAVISRWLGADTAANHDVTVAQGTNETDIVEVAKSTRYKISFYLDVNALVAAAEGGTLTIRAYNKIDQATYREVGKASFIVGADTTHPSFEFNMVNHNVKFSIQCSSAVTVTRTINYRYITQDME